MATRRLPRFLAWLAVGVAYALSLVGALTIGIFVLPFAIGATVWLATRRRGADGITGLISGLGVPFLYVAYLNRAGPGNVCTTHSGGEQCLDEFNPLPWLVLGLGLIVAGAVLFTLVERHRAPATI